MSARDPLDVFHALRSAPPPPPFARVEAAIEAPDARIAPRRRLVAVAAALAAAAGLALVLPRLGPAPATPSPLDLSSPGLLALPGDAVFASAPAPFGWRDGSARAVLDTDTLLSATGRDGATLVRGRAWFEVRPGRPADRPFLVVTPFGDVRVKGTSFEVAVDEKRTAVQVVSGVVQVEGADVAAGRRWADGRLDDAEPFPGAWFRTPRLALEASGAATAGAPVALTARFENPGHVPFDLQRRSGAPATLWLSVRAPDGGVQDVPLGADEGWEPGEPLPLGPRETVEVRVRLLRPFASRGSYRVTALYRPSDGPPVRSDEVGLQVR